MDILITGSIAFDYLMRYPAKFHDALVTQALDKISVSFLVDEMTRHFGGIAANIAYSHALLGGRPRLMGTVGKDFGPYREWLDKAGVDTSTVVVIEDIFTASFFANTDIDNNQIGSFYGGAMNLAGNYKISDVTEQTPDFVVISPNAPDAMNNLIDECSERGIPFLYDPSQQVARMDGESLRHGVERSKMVMCNEYEWGVIEQKTGLKMENVLDSGTTLVITRGKDGSNVYDQGKIYSIPVFEGVTAAEPTGVGDGFRGGFLRGMEFGWSWEMCCKIGSVVAAYVLETVGTQNHHYTPETFVERFRQQFDDEGLLDNLLKEKSAQ